MAEVVIYGRPGCHLCEEALGLLRRVRSRIAFDLREVDIEQDDELLARYLERIPVVVIDGHEAFELFIEEAELERRLAPAPAGRSPLVE